MHTAAIPISTTRGLTAQGPGEVPKAQGVGDRFETVLTETRTDRDARIRADAVARRSEEASRRDAAVERDLSGRRDPTTADDAGTTGLDPTAQRNPAAESVARAEHSTGDPADRPAATSAPGPAIDGGRDGDGSNAASRQHATRGTTPPAGTRPSGSNQSDDHRQSGPSNHPNPGSPPQPSAPLRSGAEPIAATIQPNASTPSTGKPAAVASPTLDATRAASTNTRPTATTAGYRSTGNQQLELLQQARESVFKQLALTLNKQGTGRMRLWLEPRELGRIDVQLSVSAGNVAKLWIRTEHADLGAMLDQHREGLLDAVREAGFDVQEGEIEYGDESTGERPAGDPRDPRTHDRFSDGPFALDFELGRSEPEATAANSVRAANALDGVVARDLQSTSMHIGRTRLGRLEFWA